MLKFGVALVACVQVLTLLFMAGQREYIRANGDIIYLRTAPLDPRDPLRGDYVRLQYDINTLRPRHLLNSDLNIDQDSLPKKDDVLYVSLNNNDGVVAEFANVSLTPPGDQLYIKGRVNYSWLTTERYQLNIRYGIEQFFVQQGKGLELEEKMGRRGEMQIPLEVEIALGGNGTAVIRGYRWSQLGIQTTVLRPENPPDSGLANQAVSPHLKITIQNVSAKPLALVDNEYHCGFSLASEGWTSNFPEVADQRCVDYQPQAEDVIVLNPEQSHDFEFDLGDPRWHLIVENETREIATFGFGEQFRLTYRSPDKEEIINLPAGAEIWLGDLPSRAFYGTGRVD